MNFFFLVLKKSELSCSEGLMVRIHLCYLLRGLSLWTWKDSFLECMCFFVEFLSACGERGWNPKLLDYTNFLVVFGPSTRFCFVNYFTDFFFILVKLFVYRYSEVFIFIIISCFDLLAGLLNSCFKSFYWFILLYLVLPSIRSDLGLKGLGFP